jgi:DNA-directed RNA polymerase subunit alpha
LTVGNALRRFPLEGYAITSIRIEGVTWVFNYLGVVEDVTEIIQSKTSTFQRQIEDIDNESVTISISGKDQLLVIFKNF